MIDTEPQTTELAVLDFTPSLPCEQDQHEGQATAWALVRTRCPACGNTSSPFLLCRLCWHLYDAGNHCLACGAHDLARGAFLTVLRKVRDS